MSRKHQTDDSDEMRPEYDFTNAVRGKYYERYRRGTNVVVLDPDLSEVFPNAAAVNDALRLLVTVADAKAGRPQHTVRPINALQPTSRVPAKAKTKRRSRAARG